MIMQSQERNWKNLLQLSNRSYVCGYCHTKTGANIGYQTASGDNHGAIYICGGCNRPTYFAPNNSGRFPSAALGQTVKHLPDDIETLYEDARKCTSLGAYTACVLSCRKILLHIAHDNGATNKDISSFRRCINWLEAHHYLPPKGLAWVDRIRAKGNEANHEIVITSPKEAEDVLRLTAGILRHVYELTYDEEDDSS